MRNIIRTAIQGGGYDLSDMLGKIEAQWVGGRITQAERDELADMACRSANAADSFAPVLNRVAAAEARIADIEKRLAALEAPEGETPEGGETGQPAEHAEWKQPTGAHDCYKVGDVVSRNGQLWVCVAGDGSGLNSWEPGVYGWQVYEPAEQ